MPKKRAASSTSNPPAKKKAASKKKSKTTATSKSNPRSTTKTTKRTAKKSSTKRVVSSKLTMKEVPSELIEQIASEIREELRSEIDTKVQSAIAKEREYLASISTPCRYRPDDEDVQRSYDGRKTLSNKEQVPKTKIRFVNEIPDEYLRVEDERKRRWKQLKPQYDRGIELMEKYGKKIMNTPGVTGLHVGFKRENDKIIHPLQYSLRISVRRKRDKTDPRIFKKLPSRIDGYPTDVLEREFESLGDCEPADSIIDGAIAINSANQIFDNTVVDPLCGGIPISALDTPNNWGTFGITGRGNDGKYYGLTCDHVASKRRSANTTEVIQPPLSEIVDLRVIGRVVESVRNQSVDMSIIELDYKAGVGKFYQFHDAVGPTPLLNIGSAKYEQSAFLVGAASSPKAMNTGRIQAVLGHVRTTDNHIFYDQVIVVKRKDSDADLIKPGDSGSVLFVKNPNLGPRPHYSAIGLAHTKANNGAIVACPWKLMSETSETFSSIRWI